MYCARTARAQRFAQSNGRKDTHTHRLIKMKLPRNRIIVTTELRRNMIHFVMIGKLWVREFLFCAAEAFAANWSDKETRSSVFEWRVAMILVQLFLSICVPTCKRRWQIKPAAFRFVYNKLYWSLAAACSGLAGTQVRRVDTNSRGLVEVVCGRDRCLITLSVSIICVSMFTIFCTECMLKPSQMPTSIGLQTHFFLTRKREYFFFLSFILSDARQLFFEVFEHQHIVIGFFSSLPNETLSVLKV